VIDIKAYLLSLLSKNQPFNLVLHAELILSIIYSNPCGNDLVLALYITVLIFCTCELKRTNYYLLI
jgi:hypothetical protein